MIPDTARSRFLGKIPEPPRCKVGDVLTCEVRGEMRVRAWHHRGKMPWPKGRELGRARGGLALIVSAELAAAVRVES